MEQVACISIRLSVKILEHQIQDIPVNEKRIEFIVSNYKEINEIISMRDEYISIYQGQML